MSLMSFSLLVAGLCILVALVVGILIVAVDRRSENRYEEKRQLVQQQYTSSQNLNASPSSVSDQELQMVADNFAPANTALSPEQHEAEQESRELERIFQQEPEPVAQQEPVVTEPEQPVETVPSQPSQPVVEAAPIPQPIVEETPAPSVEPPTHTLNLDPGYDMGELERVMGVWSMVKDEVGYPGAEVTWKSEDGSSSVALVTGGENPTLELRGNDADLFAEGLPMDLPIF